MSGQAISQETAHAASDSLRAELRDTPKTTTRSSSNQSHPTISGAECTAHDSLQRPQNTTASDPALLSAQLSREEDKRDSAIASSTQSDCRGSMENDADKVESGAGIPKIVVDQQQNGEVGKRGMKALQPQPRKHGLRIRPATAVHDSRGQPDRQEQILRPSTASHFRGISTVIPSSSLEGLSSLSNLRFSNRGTLVLGDEEADALWRSTESSQLPTGAPAEAVNQVSTNVSEETSTQVPAGTPTTRRRPSTHRLQHLDDPSPRLLSADDVMLSQRVRSMYEAGSEHPLGDIPRPRSAVARQADASQTDTLRPQAGQSFVRPLSRVSAPFPREDNETAGGIEDWEDLNGEDVDRYGFILPVSEHSQDTSRNAASPRPKMQRISSSLLLASQKPRQKRTIGRSPSKATSSRSNDNQESRLNRRPSKKSSRPASSMHSEETGRSQASSQSRYRIATNKLPHNRKRRIVDEAGDMLTLPPGLPDIEEEGQNSQIAYKIKSKEWSREEKWRKMAKPSQAGPKGGGMIFEFDVRNPKVISRTWKGVPDKWRSSAWHAFLSASARRRKIGETDEELVERYFELQEEDSKDDVQIDTDVPRTISDHVMFRKRYRGGQRLLFRVLHAISLYFPDTGYVQGMASIAAMFLNYYDEEQAFVMLVRVWELRGLEALYKTGFEGLMSTLETFEKKWLAGGQVARKLDELGIASTAYATRWYLTIFNISIPFPAQLRVWDVFLLLGDAAPPTKTPPAVDGKDTNQVDFGGADLDVLHATSMALIDATREILLDSDFENAMKTLTSQIPVRDEDILMRVAKTEWKAKKKRSA
ncbi:MAG: hypothetical protein Q9165_001327 [Trypethelium subeluteriae]